MYTSSHLWQSGNSDTMLDTPINKRYLLWEKTFGKNLEQHSSSTVNGSATGEDDTRYNKNIYKKHHKWAEAQPSNDVNSINLLFCVKMNVVWCRCARRFVGCRLTPILYGCTPVADCRRRCAMVSSFLWFLFFFFSILYSVLVAEPRAALIRSKS